MKIIHSVPLQAEVVLLLNDSGRLVLRFCEGTGRVFCEQEVPEHLMGDIEKLKLSIERFRVKPT